MQPSTRKHDWQWLPVRSCRLMATVRRLDMDNHEPYRPPSVVHPDAPLISKPNSPRPVLQFAKGIFAATLVFPLGPLIWLMMLSLAAYMRGDSPAIWNDAELWQFEFKDKLEVAFAISGMGAVVILFGTFFDFLDAIRKANLQPSPNDE